MTQRYLELQRGQAEVRAQKSQQRYVNCKKNPSNTGIPFHLI